MKKAFCNVIITLFFIALADFLMIMIHEFGHTIPAWLMGHLKSPFDFFFSMKGLFFVDNKIDYDQMILQGYHISAGIISAIPNILNALIYVVCAYLLYSPKLKMKPHLYHFTFWFMITNFGQFYSYVYRTFNVYGDGDIIIKALNISGYWLFVPGMLVIVFGGYNILKDQIPRLYKVLKANTLKSQIPLLFIILIVLFGYYGEIVFSITHKIYTFLIYPFSLIILFFLVCFPKNRWVQNKLKRL